MADILEIIKKYIGKRTIQPQNEYLSMWYEWYQGKSKDFHPYKIYNGSNYVNKVKRSLGMAKKGCEDWANLLLNEKTDIIIKEKDKLDAVLEKTGFWLKANEGVEKTFALGCGALLASVNNLTINEEGKLINDNNGEIKIDFINAFKIYPITIKSGKVIECAFVNRNSNEINISIHLLNGKNYEITNLIGKVQNDNYIFTDEAYIFNTMSDIPWFYILKPNIVNNQDINSSLGISIFANSIDVLKNIDNAFDTYDNEFEQGKKRTYVSTKALKINVVDGECVKVFDSSDTTFYVLPEDEDGKNYVNTDSPELRIDSLIAGIQKSLDLFSFTIGLGTGYYKFDSSGLKTATEVISENSDTFRTIKKHEILLEEALREFTRAILYICNTFTKDKFDVNQDIEIKFDDSIIEDKQAEKNNDRQDVNMGIMSKLEYRMKWYGEDEATARKKLKNVQEEQPEIIE